MTYHARKRIQDTHKRTHRVKARELARARKLVTHVVFDLHVPTLPPSLSFTQTIPPIKGTCFCFFYFFWRLISCQAKRKHVSVSFFFIYFIFVLSFFFFFFFLLRFFVPFT